MNFGECKHNNIGGCSECEEELEDENSELKIEVKQLKAVVSAVGAALPSGARYLDPPDGGDVSFGEQVRRIVEDLTAEQEQTANLAADLINANARVAELEAAIRYHRESLTSGRTVCDQVLWMYVSREP